MRLLRIENFRYIDGNKAGGDACLEYGDKEVRAEFIFYLQGNDCLNIRLGRHDTRVSTQELEDFLAKQRQHLRQGIKPEVERIRQERRDKLEISRS
ncbi:MAG: hypothetical protein GX119_07930 [Syntrophomonadaceae bacterium]|jgi:hypothetical protein|nr:hypothetical protein [Syntrophomonadaceae bacterium]